MTKVWLMLCLLVPLATAAKSGPAEEPLNAIETVAMDGFDVIAYFKDGKPRKGDAANAVEYQGKTWVFASPANAQVFSDNPKVYAPQFNGWCAYAVSEGYSAEVDFINGWSILDGRLYLNWNRATRDDFIAEQANRKAEAAENWPKVRRGLIDGSLRIHRHQQHPRIGITHPQPLY